MKKILLILFCFPIIGFGQQTLNIGHTSINFYDNSRNRNINTEIYYPANINGDDVAISIGNFPIIVFGHGFLIGWEAYENFWISLVSEGYIKSCERTEEAGKPVIKIVLKYHNSAPAIKTINRISKPSLRKYSASSDIKSVKNGLGAFIISTNQGLMTDKEAKAKNVGGEILCEVF